MVKGNKTFTRVEVPQATKTEENEKAMKLVAEMLAGNAKHHRVLRRDVFREPRQGALGFDVAEAVAADVAKYWRRALVGKSLDRAC